MFWRRLLNTTESHANLEGVCMPDSQCPGTPARLLLIATQNIGKGCELLL